MITRDPFRDAFGLALAYLDEDDALAAELLAPYSFRGDELGLLVAVLGVMTLERDEDELAELLYGVALAGALA